MLTQPLPPQASPSLKQRTPICTRDSVNPRQDGLFTHSVTLKKRKENGKEGSLLLIFQSVVTGTS